MIRNAVNFYKCTYKLNFLNASEITFDNLIAINQKTINRLYSLYGSFS